MVRFVVWRTSTWASTSPIVECFRHAHPREPSARGRAKGGLPSRLPWGHTVNVSQFVIHLGMAQAISVRLDDDAEQALRALEASGLSRSEAIRVALVESARRLRRSSELAAEVARLEADDADRAEMTAIAQLMESLRATG